MEEGKNGGKKLVFLLGGAIGALLGLFFAPKSGKESRKKAKVFFENANGGTEELIEACKEKIEELMHPSKTAVKK